MMSLAIVSEVLQAPLSGSDARFTGVSIDTRELAKGDLFVALKGPNFDGHNFLAEAISGGAMAAMLSRAIDTSLPYVRVDDTRTSLGRLAAFWRSQFDIPVIGITGSNGKTSVKEMVATILKESAPACVTHGNRNNDIGVPLTLLRLRKDHRFAVIEMGMNHRGEIEYLTGLTRPTVALITNAQEAHLAGVGTVADVAQEKSTIFSGLASDGIAVINADDPFYELWKGRAAPRRTLSFGLERPADVTAVYTAHPGGSFMLLLSTYGDIEMRLPLLGRHNVMNALAASTAAMAAGAAIKDVKSGIEKLKAVSGRLEVKDGISGACVIDDTYNANPGSLAAGLQALKELRGERVLVLGDMGELGESAPDIHRRVGELARQIGIQRLFTLGDLSALAAKSFGTGGRHFESATELIEALHDCMHSEMVVLVKGSRVMHMERVVAGVVRGRNLHTGLGHGAT